MLLCYSHLLNLEILYKICINNQYTTNVCTVDIFCNYMYRENIIYNNNIKVLGYLYFTNAGQFTMNNLSFKVPELCEEFAFLYINNKTISFHSFFINKLILCLASV